MEADGAYETNLASTFIISPTKLKNYVIAREWCVNLYLPVPIDRSHHRAALGIHCVDGAFAYCLSVVVALVSFMWRG